MTKSNATKAATSACIIGLALGVTGCMSYSKAVVAVHEAIDEVLSEKPVKPPVTETPTNPQSADDIDLSSVRWHGPDIRSWPITSDLAKVSIGRNVSFPHSKAGQWPKKAPPSGDGYVEANVWLIANVDGQWHASSFEWLRPGQTSKPAAVVNGAHAKASPLSGSWAPKAGDTLYFAVAGLSRGGYTSVQERTAFRKAVWP